jgi:hypothetical protein
MASLRPDRSVSSHVPAARTPAKGSGNRALDPPAAISNDHIAKRAYEIYAKRGFSANPDDDWFEAERQLRAGI